MQRDLTQGRIGLSLIKFSLPMICGNLLQQMYNIVDTLIVGRTIGATALSAVGSAYALMVLLTSIILGLCMGGGVVFAQFYGARRIDEMKTGIFNAFLFIMGVSLALNAAVFLLLEKFIVWLSIPTEAVAYTREYLRIIFVGLTAVNLYNFLASVLRSIGNTLVPLVFLAVSSVTNIVLDLLFITVFHMGVAGAAWATVISQYLSAACIAVYFFFRAREFCPQRRHMRFDKKLLALVIENSTLTAVQQSIMNFGILMVQGLVNSFGYAVSAAFAATVKIDAFAYMPAQDFGNAFSTFIAQNYGAEKKRRILQGAALAGAMSAAFCALSSLCVCAFARPLMEIFIRPEETEIIRIGVRYLRIEGAAYVGIGILFLLYGFYRGLGRAGMSIVLTVISLGSRVLLAYTLSAVPMIGLVGIWVSIPIGWALADIFGVVWFFLRRKKGLLEKR